MAEVKLEIHLQQAEATDADTGAVVARAYGARLITKHAQVTEHLTVELPPLFEGGDFGESAETVVARLRQRVKAMIESAIAAAVAPANNTGQVQYPGLN